MEKTYQQKYYEKNKARRKSESLAYAKANGNKSQRKWSKKWRARLKQAVFEILGKECSICGFSDIRALQVDHIKGNGSRERKKLSGNYYKFILGDVVSNPNKYQTLCANCNWIERSENDENRKVGNL